MKLSSKPKFFRTIRSFVRRSGRRTSAQKKAWDNYWSVYGANPEIGPLDLNTLFENKNQKFILEIGFGNGENLIDCARNDPYSNFAGIEVYPVGIGQCLMNANKYSLKNLRIFCDDAVCKGGAAELGTTYAACTTFDCKALDVCLRCFTSVAQDDDS